MNFDFGFSSASFLGALECWKDEKCCWSKTETQLPKKCKISFLPCFSGCFRILSAISLSGLCMNMMWPQVDFRFDNIALSFQIKNPNLKRFAHDGWQKCIVSKMLAAGKLSKKCKISCVPCCLGYFSILSTILW